MSNPEEMILKQLAMCFYTSWEDNYHGKDFLVRVRMRSTLQLRRRRLKHLSKNSRKVTLKSSNISWSIVASWASLMILTTTTSWTCLKVAWRDMATMARLWITLGSRIDWAGIKKRLRIALLMSSGKRARSKKILNKKRRENELMLLLNRHRWQGRVLSVDQDTRLLNSKLHNLNLMVLKRDIKLVEEEALTLKTQHNRCSINERTI